MAFSFKKWFAEQFPEFFHVNDTYKNLNGEGLWIRYVKNYGQELDDNFYPYIQSFINLLDTIKCDQKLLGHLSFNLGLPPSIENNFDAYRRILAYAVHIYKIKGTAKSYELLFNVLGINISIVEEIPRKATRYDDEDVRYDSTFRYDDECEYCSYYSIAYYDPANPLDPVPDNILERFDSIICFLQPINAKLRGFVRSLFLQDTYEIDFTEEVIFNDGTDGAFSIGFDQGEGGGFN